MPGAVETSQVGQRQDLSDYIVNVQRQEFPLFTSIPKDTVHKTTFETQIEDYGDTNDLSGVPSGKDVDTFQDMSDTRGIIENSVQKMWETPKVDDFSENVSENPALSAGEYAHAVKKAIVRIKIRTEKRLLSQREAAKQGKNGANAYETCGFFGFLKPKDVAFVGTQDVPERYRTPTGQRFTGSFSSFEEATIREIMRLIYEVTNGKGTFTGIVGSQLKQRISDMAIFQPERAGSVVVRRVNTSDVRTLRTTVDVIEGDAGVVAIQPSTRINWQQADGSLSTEAQRQQAGLLLDMEMWGLAFKRKPGHKPLADGGGGPRGVVDTIFGLRCKAPHANAAILPS